MFRKLILAVLVCLPALSVCAHAMNTPPFDLNDPKRIELGKLRFNSTCAGYCHGFEGVGGNAPTFKGMGSDFDPNYAFETITNGRTGHGAVMPRWGGAFTPEQIWELVAYLQFLANEKPDQTN
ncbi:cytochrome c [Rhodoblastus sp.]|jgi:mono/diheme cytochrome c family protein|uniref:c-type cytochrome n=1 Tax=Rhodoblastus sp. TaxID=1962975 RepID=UPI002614D049|nr:cytochrome c [Rhodoblastus sp.]